jgi:hypothetical protein
MAISRGCLIVLVLLLLGCAGVVWFLRQLPMAGWGPGG